MTAKKTEEISSVEKMTKQEMAKIIKTAKRQAESLEKDTISICDVMKNNTSEIIQKIESKFKNFLSITIINNKQKTIGVKAYNLLHNYASSL